MLFRSALGLAGCSVPTLESPQCTDARLAVKQFYSYHFGNDMTPSAEHLKERQKYLTSDLYKSLSASGDARTDYFTKSDEYPKTFKIADCESGDASHATLKVQTYWQAERGAIKDTTQRAVNVAAIKTQDGRWLINSVEDATQR